MKRCLDSLFGTFLCASTFPGESRSKYWHICEFVMLRRHSTRAPATYLMLNSQPSQHKCERQLSSCLMCTRSICIGKWRIVCSMRNTHSKAFTQRPSCVNIEQANEKFYYKLIANENRFSIKSNQLAPFRMFVYTRSVWKSCELTMHLNQITWNAILFLEFPFNRFALIRWRTALQIRHMKHPFSIKMQLKCWLRNGICDR